MAALRSSMASEFERVSRTIFKRCVECPSALPTCPSCGEDEICSLVPQGCMTCSYMQCIKNPNPLPSSKGPNVGAIAGGVVGGVVLVALAVFLVWRFWIKRMREQQDRELEDEWDNDDVAHQKRRSEFNRSGSGAASTRSQGSLANSILSRASNIIQIAYIPGVTNRGGSGTNSMYHSTPVPPIPAAFRSGQQTPKSPLSKQGDALFFRPGDLRDSTWSDSGSFDASRNRDTQYTMHSITPSLARESVASDVVYFDDATATPMPANVIQKSSPRMVSIKSSSGGTSPDETSDSRSTQKSVQIMMPAQGNGASAGGATGMRMKPTQVTVGSRGKSQRGNPLSNGSGGLGYTPLNPSPLSGHDRSSDSELDDEPTRERRSLIDVGEDTSVPQPQDSPFFDASELPSAAIAIATRNRPNPYASMASSIGRAETSQRRRTKSIGGLSAVIEEAARRASRASENDGQSVGGDRSSRITQDSPFSDAHATE